MKRLQEEYSEQGLAVIWIGFQDRPDKLRKYAADLGLDSVGYDNHNDIARQYGVTYGAGVIFIDAEGIVRKRVAKGFTDAALRESVLKIVQPPASAPASNNAETPAR